jgi:hypothetical protein
MMLRDASIDANANTANASVRRVGKIHGEDS